MERIDLLNYYNSTAPVKKRRRRKYKYNVNKLLITFLLLIFTFMVALVLLKYEIKSDIPIDSNIFEEFSSEEMISSKDILDVNFEETVPHEVTLHIPENELKIIEDQVKQQETTGNYIVKKGDSLWSIAQKYGMSIHKLAKINNISSSKVLKVGQILNVNEDFFKMLSSEVKETNNNTPVKVNKDEYIVKKGDSLWSIACKYGVYVSTLQYLNDLKTSSLRVGQKVKVANKNVRSFDLDWDMSLEQLSNYFNVSFEELLKLNPEINSNEKMNAGTSVNIPNKNPYFVNSTEVKYFGSYVSYWPLKGKIASPYGWRKHPVYQKKIFHNGIDIENVKGTPIVAAGGGKVIFASYKGNSGKLVIIQHKNGYQSIYAHLDKIKVKKGKIVNQGEIIGTTGNTGVSTGAHLHFGIRKNGKFINPMNFLN